MIFIATVLILCPPLLKYKLLTSKNLHHARASVPQLDGALSHSQKVAGLRPGHGTSLGCRFNCWSGQVPSLVWACVRGNQSMPLSHINVSLSCINVSLSLPLSLKAMEKCPQLKIKKKIFIKILFTVISQAHRTGINL